MRMRVGVIGVGNMGAHHARVYASIPSAELVAVADPNGERAREVATKYRCRYYEDYREMIRREQLHAVSIATPTSLHYTVSADTLRAKIHTLVEKPLAQSVEQALELASIAKSCGVLLAVGHVERYNPAVIELKRLVKHGVLGSVISIAAKRVGMMPPQINDTNVILDLAVHDIDVINFLLESEPTDATATAGAALLNNRYDHSEIFLKYGEIGCFIQVNWVTPVKIRTLAVTGTRAYAELNYITQDLYLFEINIKEKAYTDFGDFVIKFGESQKMKVPIEVKEPLRVEIETFIKSIQGESCDLVTGDDAIKVLKVIEHILNNLQAR